MKLYKTLLLLLIFLGGIFIGTSDPVKNMYKNFRDYSFREIAGHFVLIKNINAIKPK